MPGTDPHGLGGDVDARLTVHEIVPRRLRRALHPRVRHRLRGWILGGLNRGPINSTPPPFTMPFCRLVSSTTSTSPSVSSFDVSALYLKKQNVPSARLFALEAIFV